MENKILSDQDLAIKAVELALENKSDISSIISTTLRDAKLILDFLRGEYHLTEDDTHLIK